ncbi:MAG: hypothetical protein ACJAUP_000435 [Cellvibrionaceae bacterium]|jgi:hypothetical protein
MPDEIVQQVDPHYIAPMSEMSARHVWPSYKKTPRLSVETSGAIKAQAQQTVMINTKDGKEIPSTSGSQASVAMYLKPWAVNRMDSYDYDRGLYNDLFMPIKK